MSSYLFGKNVSAVYLGSVTFITLISMPTELFSEVQLSSEGLKPWPFFIWPWPWEVRYVWIMVVWKDFTDSFCKGPMHYAFFFIFFINLFINILIAASPSLSPPSPPSPLSYPKSPLPFSSEKGDTSHGHHPSLAYQVAVILGTTFSIDTRQCGPIRRKGSKGRQCSHQ